MQWFKVPPKIYFEKKCCSIPGEDAEYIKSLYRNRSNDG